MKGQKRLMKGKPMATDSSIRDSSVRKSPLAASALQVGYGTDPVIEDLNLVVPANSFTVIIGPNACGKSTLLRSLARLLEPQRGSVILDGKDIREYPSKVVARRLGLLPQSSSSPRGITVRDLVARGRFPHQSLLRQWSVEDDAAVARALSATGLSELADRKVDELSGGQRQRVWISLVLAQETPLLLLDEPTTFLDITHQLEILKLCRQLNRSGYTLVAVLHDLNLAFRFATHVIVMKEGRIVAAGAPDEVVTAALIEDVYGIPSICVTDPVTGRPMVIPLDESNHDTGPSGAAVSATVFGTAAAIV
jgi:iron complex transport system ATP-binding protein